MKLLNSVASVLMSGEFLAQLVHIHAIFHRYCAVHCKRMIPRENASITRMCILVTLPLSCTVVGVSGTLSTVLSYVVVGRLCRDK